MGQRYRIKEKSNPNARFRFITILFAIIFIISLVGNYAYQNQDKIKSWFESEDESQEKKNLNNQGNVVIDDFQADILNSIIPLVIIILIVFTIIVLISQLLLRSLEFGSGI